MSYMSVFCIYTQPRNAIQGTARRRLDGQRRSQLRSNLEDLWQCGSGYCGGLRNPAPVH